MEKLSEYKKDYYFFTGKLSDINRQISFAGIALIWIFRESNESGVIINDKLILPAILIVLGLAFDLLQYIYQSIIWASFYTYQKRKGKSEDKKVKSPEYFNYPSWAFFILKIGFIILAYWKICWFLIDKFA